MRQEKEEGNEPLLISQLQVDDPHHSRQQQQSNCFDLISRTWLESKKVWKIAGPSIFGRLSMFPLTFITQPFACHLGDLKLSAISISTTIIIAITFGFLVKHPILYVCVFVSSPYFDEWRAEQE
ncbi:hypothetical protein LguiA_011752 [Lonicera macranthoides]